MAVRSIQLALKRILDLLVSGAILFVLSPVLLMVAFAVRLSSRGPVIFRQERLGKDGKRFMINKFRTMYEEAPELTNSDGSTYSGSADARITRIGMLLRKSSLDELPQLLNVLVGDMSLVGPRPDLASQLSLYEPHEHRKLLMKPGITGWAMVMGRNSIDWSRRKELDIYYVDHFSLWFDIQILLRTIPVVLLGVGVMSPAIERSTKRKA